MEQLLKHSLVGDDYVPPESKMKRKLRLKKAKADAKLHKNAGIPTAIANK